jgi:hypothetical protein
MSMQLFLLSAESARKKSVADARTIFRAYVG